MRATTTVSAEVTQIQKGAQVPGCPGCHYYSAAVSFDSGRHPMLVDVASHLDGTAPTPADFVAKAVAVACRAAV